MLSRLLVCLHASIIISYLNNLKLIRIAYSLFSYSRSDGYLHGTESFHLYFYLFVKNFIFQYRGLQRSNDKLYLVLDSKHYFQYIYSINTIAQIVLVRTNAQLKEGDTVSMSCQQVESNCRKHYTCTVTWRFKVSEEASPDNICGRQTSPPATDCGVPTDRYRPRVSYQSNGVVHIQSVTKEESGIYYCECRCTTLEDSQYYYGVIIVRK